MNDPFVEFVAQVQAELDPLYDRYKAFEGAMTQLRPRWIEAITAGRLTYPDANSTKRLTYGVVKGYSPGDAIQYDYYTTAEGIVEKYTGEYPFNSPQAQLDQIAAQEFGMYRDAVTGKMHINFLNTLDTTGGNSGSPVLNGRGELIGLLFDGNYESIVADYIFDPGLTRSICVDIRYTLWYMSKVDDATHLLEEMTIN